MNTKKGHKMYQRMLSLLVTISLCMGLMPDTNVYAAELPEEIKGNFFTADDMGTGDDPASGESATAAEEIEIPQNGSEVHMEDTLKTQPSTTRRRAMKKASTKRYTVLVLDTSAPIDFLYNGYVMYTADTALLQVIEASEKFVEAMEDVSGDNYIAIVSYGDVTSEIISPFTNDKKALLKSLDSINHLNGIRNVHSGLTAAEELIDSVSDQNAVKNVVLFTTGITNAGPYDYTGHYNSSTVGSKWRVGGENIPIYAYANSAYAAAEQLKEKCTVYSIGLFKTLENMPEQGKDIVKFFKLCACDWASSKNHFYDVKDSSNLTFVFGQVADNILKCTGTFSYPSKGNDYTATYYYDDNYFKASSYEHNQHLATMSLCLELSAWGSEDEIEYTKKMNNAKELLNELGFIGFDHNYTDFAEEDIIGKPTKDSVGVVAANKPLSFDGKEYTLIAVAIRGGGYEREWASNVTVGKSGHHAGFSQARDTVIAFLQKYIKEQGISGDIKIWITGYSRAGATANMVAGAIDSGDVDLEGCHLELKDLFAYTFETPAGVVDPNAEDAKYDNIFNVINKNDPVPLVAPEHWNFTRYGKDIIISSPEEDDKELYEKNVAAMLEQFRKMDSYKSYDVDNFQMKKTILIIVPGKWNPLISFDYSVKLLDDTKDDKKQSKFLNDFVTSMAKNYLKDRTNYVANYQSGMRDACGIFFGTSSLKKDILYVSLTNQFLDNFYFFLLSKLTGEKEAIAQKTAECLEKSLKEAGITNYNEDEFKDAVVVLSDLLINFAEDDLKSVATLLGNSSGILQAHEPDLCLAWMQSMDTNYTTDAQLRYSTGKYRIVRINCPIDVRVYDAEGNLLASIIDDTPQPDSRVVVSYNDQGEKLVYLPVYHDYVIKLTATDDGVMNYAVQEYDHYAGETNHLSLFHDIEITKGQEYTAYLPRYSEAEVESRTGTAADTDYTLFLGSTQIPLSEELTDEKVFNAYYDVNASTEDIQKGIVFGSGIRQYGTFAKVEAIAVDGYELAGWYEGENLVSTEAEYRFRVSRDIELVAVFQESTQEKTPEGNTGDQTDQGTGDGKDNHTGDNTGDNKTETIAGVFRVITHWNAGFTGTITLTNTTDEVIHNWMVAFDLPYEITNLWNGVITSHENGVYTVENAGYNREIPPGESVTFGFCANAETETITEPTYYTLIEKPAKTVDQGYEIAYKVNSDWGTAFTGQIEISNVSSREMLDWTLEFDCNHNIHRFWNAEIISHKGNHYVITNKGYNAAIGAGQTLMLGFEASSSISSGEKPLHYNLTSVDRASAP